MSTDFSIRPAGVPAPAPAVQPQSPAAGNAVATQLPTRQSVTAADPNAAIRNDPQLVNEDFVTHQAFFDQAAASLVFQEVDDKDDQVIEQYPDDAVLRRRAYFHALDLAKDSRPRAIPTDRTA